MKGIVVVVVEGIVVVVVIIMFLPVKVHCNQRGAKRCLENSVTFSCLSRVDQYKFCIYGSLTSIKSL